MKKKNATKKPAIDWKKKLEEYPTYKENPYENGTIKTDPKKIEAIKNAIAIQIEIASISKEAMKIIKDKLKKKLKK